jgi:Domain of unknown function (DUF4439)
MTAPATTTATGLRVVLTAELTVVWAYSLVGGKIGGALRPAVSAAQAIHRDRVTDLTDRLQAIAATPPDPAPAYDVPFPVTGTTSALRLAIHLEDGVAAAWRYLIGAAEDASLRRLAVATLGSTAVQASIWRTKAKLPASQAFPGT